MNLRSLAFLLLAAVCGCRSTPPTVTTFVVDPAAVDLGSPAFLKWDCPGATSIQITANGEEVATSDKATGSTQVTAQASTTYNLVARNDGGFASANATLTVRRPPKIISFTSAPTKLAPGDEVTLAWVTDSVAQVFLTRDGETVSIDPTITTGTTVLKLGHTSTFVLTGRGDTSEVTSTLTVNVATPPVIGSFTAAPEILDPGEKAILTWSGVTDATSVKLQDDTGRTLPTGGPINGSYQVTPDRTTTYSLVAEGFGGRTTAMATVEVRPVIKSFTADQVAVAPGSKVLLAWATAAADNVVINESGRRVVTVSGAQASSGSFIDTVPSTATGTVTYELDADGTKRTIDLPVGAAPVISRFEAQPGSVLAGTGPNLMWETSGAVSVQIKVGTSSQTTVTSATRVASGNYAAKAISADTTYDLIAKSAIGVVSTLSTTVKIAPAVAVLNFSASPNPLARGGDLTTLAWTANASAVEATVTDAAGTQIFTTTDPAQAKSGSVGVRPSSTTTYTLKLKGVAGDSVSKNATVSVTQPLAFSTSPTVIVPGEHSTLTWDLSATGATTVNIAPRPFIRGSHAFVDLATGAGTALTFANDDDATATLTFPTGFTFPFAGGPRSAVTVSTNGWVGFGASYASSLPANEAFPSANLADAVAPFWDDLKLGTGQVYWSLVGTAPNRELLISFEGVGLKSGTAAEGSLSFQVSLGEGGDVEFRYKSLTSSTQPRAQGSSATVGIAPGADGSNFSVNAAALSDGSSVTFPATLLPSGTAEVAPLVSRTFVLSATSGATPLSASTTVQVLQPGDVDFSEVMFDPPATLGASGQWIELRSRVPYAVDLSGFTLSVDGTQMTLPALVLPANGRRVLGATTDTMLNGGVTVDFAWTSGLILPATKSTLTLTARGATLATLAYDAAAGFAHVPGASLVIDDVAKSTTPGASTCAALNVYDATSGALGTPGAANDPCFFAVSARADFVDITGTMNAPAVSGSGATTAAVAVPFTFTWFGQPCTSLTVSLHGFAACGATSSSHPANGPIPWTSLPNGLLAPFWDEQNQLSKSKVLWDVQGTAPDRVLVVEWSHMDFKPSTGADLNYELKIHENGDVELQYGTMTAGTAGDRATGSGATVGLEDNAGKIALPLSQDRGGAVQANTGLYFRRR